MTRRCPHCHAVLDGLEMKCTGDGRGGDGPSSYICPRCGRDMIPSSDGKPSTDQPASNATAKKPVIKPGATSISTIDGKMLRLGVTIGNLVVGFVKNEGGQVARSDGGTIAFVINGKKYTFTCDIKME